MKILLLLVITVHVSYAMSQYQQGRRGNGPGQGGRYQGVKPKPSDPKPTSQRNNDMPIVTSELKSLTKSINHIKSIVAEAEAQLKFVEKSSEKKGQVTFLTQNSYESIKEKFEDACSKLQDVRAKTKGWTTTHYRSETLLALDQTPLIYHVQEDAKERSNPTDEVISPTVAHLHDMQAQGLISSNIPAINLQAVSAILDLLKNPCNNLLANTIITTTINTECSFLGVLLGLISIKPPIPVVGPGVQVEGEASVVAQLPDGISQFSSPVGHEHETDESPFRTMINFDKELSNNEMKKNAGKNSAALLIPLYFMGPNSPDLIFNQNLAMKANQGAHKPQQNQKPGKITTQDIEKHLQNGILGQLNAQLPLGQSGQPVQFISSEWGPSFTGLINGYLNQAIHSRRQNGNVKMSSPEAEHKGFVLALVVQPGVDGTLEGSTKGQAKSSLTQADASKAVRFVPLFWPWDNPLKNVGAFASPSGAPAPVASGTSNSINSHGAEQPGAQNTVTTMTETSSMTFTSAESPQPTKA